MAKMSPDLKMLAKRAYTRGRFRLAVLHALGPLAIAAIATLVLHAPPATTVPIGVLFAIAFGYAQYRGLALGRGARHGLLLGILPFCVPALIRGSHACWIAGSCMITCMVMCTIAGAVTGFMLARSAARDKSPFEYAVAGTAMLLAIAGLGCSAIGIGEFVGVAAGLLVAMPVYVLRQRA